MRVGVAAGGTRAHCHLRSCRISHSPIAILVCVPGEFVLRLYTIPSTVCIFFPDCESLSSFRCSENIFSIVGRRFKPCNLASWISRSNVSFIFVWNVRFVFPTDFRRIPKIYRLDFAYILFLGVKFPWIKQLW